MKPHPPRAMFFVDGFNLYHSIERVQKSDPGACLKWLDLTLHPLSALFAFSVLKKACHDWLAWPSTDPLSTGSCLGLEGA